MTVGHEADAVDLFAGPGGWDVACRLLGVDVVGVEWDDAAVATREAAGHRTVHADVASLDPRQFKARGLIASPPCPAFSAAGKGEGDEHLPALVAAVHRRDWACRPADDPKVWLGLEVGRWYEALRPDWVALEQVPAVLPLWEAYAHVLRVDGFSVWTGVLCAADYGVPQTRERAILIARRSGPAIPPPPTHAREPGVALFDQRLPWVTMAEALGWGMTDRPGFTLAVGTAAGGPDTSGVGGSGARQALRREQADGRWVVRSGQYSTLPDGERQEYTRPVDEPAPTLTAKSGGQWVMERPAADVKGYVPGQSNSLVLRSRRDSASWVAEHGERPNRDVSEPAPTLTGMSYRQWVMERPATTVQCDPRLGNPGHRDRAGGERQFAADAIRLTVRDALILQGFPADYPVQGTKTKQFEQVGNAVPPLLARAVLGQLVDPPEAM